MTEIRVGLLGSTGRMGLWVDRIIHDDFAGRLRLAATAGKSDSLSPLLECDVVIDFSLPEAMHGLAEYALKRPGPLPAFVVGSTGWTAEQSRALDELSKRARVLVSTNFSTGVQALLMVLRQASPLLLKLGYEPVLVEAHHRHKKDAPSGTAITIQSAIRPESPGTVQTHAIRAGETFGDHEVTFYGKADHLVIGHFAQDRSIFARGAVEVAEWLARRASPTHGRATMEDYFRERLQ